MSLLLKGVLSDEDLNLAIAIKISLADIGEK